MNTFLRKLFTLTFIALFIGYLIGCNFFQSNKVCLDVTAKPFEKLSDYHFFTGILNELIPTEKIVPYDLITPLFSDYAFKARFVYVPEGKSAEYDTSQVLQLPVGSCLIKNFYYPEDFNKPEGKRRIMETRLLVHRDKEWDALDYIWNDEQTEAVLESAGDIKKVSWTHYDGSKKEVDYIIPNKNQCKSCHWNNEKGIQPIGPKVRNLNRNLQYATVNENQLTHWVNIGYLKNAPAPELCPKVADYKDAKNYTVDQRSRAYLAMNCAHCHNPQGPAYTSGLYLNVDNKNPENLGICKTPVAAGKATGNLFFDIMPGKPDSSILVYRMLSDDPGIRMPEVGRSLLHKEGVQLIEQWVTEMTANPCK